MTLRLLRIPAALVFCTALLASSTLAQTRPSAPESPYGGTTVEDIIARINDQIITRSDYDRALKELDQEGRQRGSSMQEMSEARGNLLRNLIDQQLWLSKGKELGITGETELVTRLNEIRKQYNLATLEDLEKAAREQGVSFEDFKANIRNGIITQEVMRNEVGSKISATPGEVQRYFEAHKQEYTQPESVRLSEILISTGTPSATEPGAVQPVDAQKLAEAQAKAEDVEAKLNAGGDFTQLARSFSDGPTASEGGDLGQFRRGALAKVLEDKTFGLKAGQYTEPIRTKQGFVILKVVQHTPGGVPQFKDVQQDVEQNYYMSRMEPAMRVYLTRMREEAYLDIRPGYTDTGASTKETKPIYSAYTPPAPKKKKKIERTRYRETARSFRRKAPEPAQAAAPVEQAAQAAPPAEQAAASVKPEKKSKKKKASKTEQAALKPGKKEKIRFGKAPKSTLPNAAPTQTEDAGAGQQVADSSAQEIANPLEDSAAPQKKTRFSYRAKTVKVRKANTVQKDPLAPEAPDAAEVADRQTQSAPLGLAGDTASKKKKKSTTTGEKTRLSDKNKKPAEQAQPQGADETPQTPAPQVLAPQ